MVAERVNTEQILLMDNFMIAKLKKANRVNNILKNFGKN
jgi:hypothetical protein